MARRNRSVTVCPCWHPERGWAFALTEPHAGSDQSVCNLADLESPAPLADVVVGPAPVPLHLADSPPLHGQPGQRSTGGKQGDDRGAKSNVDLPDGEAGQTDHKCHRGHRDKNQTRRLRGVLHRLGGEGLRRPVMVDGIVRVVCPRVCPSVTLASRALC